MGKNNIDNKYIQFTQEIKLSILTEVKICTENSTISNRQNIQIRSIYS